jgi:hypothetical protein
LVTTAGADTNPTTAAAVAIIKKGALKFCQFTLSFSENYDCHNSMNTFYAKV